MKVIILHRSLQTHLTLLDMPAESVILSPALRELDYGYSPE